MRLCAALALVLVALVVLTVKAARRHPHPVAPAEADVVEIAPAAPPVRAPAPSSVVPRPTPRVPVAPVMPANIAGQLRLPEEADPADVEIVARLSGGPEWDRIGKAGEDDFLIEGLLSGRRYDLQFRGAHVRTLTMIGVVAPAQGMDVALEPRATIRIAVGFSRGQHCPIETLVAHAGTADGAQTMGVFSFNSECRFDFEAPVSAGLVTVVAEGDTARLEAAVRIPEHGDPEPICLNPPCRANPLDGLARLRFILDGAAPDSGIIADARPVSPDANARYGCRSSAPTCGIEGLPPGEFSIDVVGPDCGAGPMTISVVAGDNDVSVPCPDRALREEKLGAEIRALLDEGA